MYINVHLTSYVEAKILHCTKPALMIYPDYQFVLVQKGAISMWVQDNVLALQKGDVIMVEPNQMVKITSQCKNTIICLRVDSACINSIIPFGYSLECNFINNPDKSNENFAKIIEELCSAFFEHGSEWKMAGLLYLLTDHIKKNRIKKTKGADDAGTHYTDRINEITTFINSHYNQSISLSSLAERMYLTPQYLSKFIKKYLGISFSKYLVNVRLEHAHIELLQTYHPIIEIAMNNGFPNVAAFNKHFKLVYHTAPVVYKQDHQTQTSKTQSKVYTFDEPVPTETKCIIKLDAHSAKPFSPPWKDTADIGELSNALGTEFQNSFKIFCGTTNVKFARCNNLFSTRLIRYHKSDDAFDFANIREAVSYLFGLGVYPFINLTMTKEYLKHIAFEQTGDEFLNPNLYDLQYCCNTLRKLLHNCIQLFGIDYVSNWRFEVSAVHDEYLKYENFDLYIHKYTAFFRVIKEVAPGCELGGPGFNMSSDLNMFCSYLAAFEERKLSFDFISVYSFCYETAGSVELDDPLSAGILSSDPNHPLTCYKQYRNAIQMSCYKDIPMYITEFGSIVSSQNFVYDSLFQAAFICKTNSDLIFEVPCLAYRCFCESIPELSFHERQYYSTSSLVAKSGIPKPSLHSYTLMGKLGKNLICNGKNFVMTCDSQYQYQLLVFNYIHFNKNFCFNSWDKIPIESTYDVFEDAKSLSVSFCCSNCIPGRYKVTQYSLNRSHGSALDKYLRVLEKGITTSSEFLATIMSLSESEVAYFRNTSVPKQDIYYISCNGVLSLEISVQPYEIQLFEFTKIV